MYVTGIFVHTSMGHAGTVRVTAATAAARSCLLCGVTAHPPAMIQMMLGLGAAVAAAAAATASVACNHGRRRAQRVIMIALLQCVAFLQDYQ